MIELDRSPELENKHVSHRQNLSCFLLYLSQYLRIGFLKIFKLAEKFQVCFLINTQPRLKGFADFAEVGKVAEIASRDCRFCGECQD